MARAWTGRDILVALIATFGVVIAVNVFFIVKAERTYPGEDVAHPYLQGVEYNDTLKDRARQAALGWHATIAAVRQGDGATVTVTLADKAGKPVGNEALSGLMRHPMNEELDRPFALKEIKPGVYAGHAGKLRAGNWDVIVSRRTSTEAPFEAERRVLLP